MLTAVRRLVEAESPSGDLDACSRCADVLTSIGTEVLATPPERIMLQGRTHLRWTFGKARVALIGHFDTVWPVGTLSDRPFSIQGDVASGPGIFDMKAGLVQGLLAAATLPDASGLELLFTSDEEIASPSSRNLIEELGRRVEAVLVLEPSQNGALKTARKGISLYRLDVTGRAAHAGLEPENGVNALVELARQVLALQGLANARGTTVTPTVAAAGIATNVVPPSAHADIDVRTWTVAEQTRVDEGMRALNSYDPGASLTVAGGPDRPPLEEVRSRALFKRALALAPALGIPDLQGVRVGGGSDGNLTAAVGTPTLDGLGAVGGGAHATDEHIIVSQMPVRAALVAALLRDLLLA